MPFRIPGRILDTLVRAAGYVPVAEMHAALAKAAELEGELRHKNANLRNNIMLRDRLENELQFMRELELAHAKKESGVQQAVDRIDNITGKLLEMMQATWPAAIVDDPTQATEETKEAAAVG